MAHCTSTEEDLVTPCVSLLDSLALHTVSHIWVDSVWDGQFTESQELPRDYKDVIKGVEVQVAFTSLKELIIKWIKPCKQDETCKGSASQSSSMYRAGFWIIMREHNINIKVLVAILYHYMERGEKVVSGKQARQLALTATGLYLVLLGLPGITTLEIFHPRLYRKALDTFTMVNMVDKENDVGQVMEVLSCYRIMLEHCSLKMNLKSIEVTVGSLVTLTHLETTNSVLDFEGWTGNNDVSSLALNAYLCLAKVSSQLHDEADVRVAEVLKGLLPGVLRIGEKPIKELEVIRSHTLEFIRFIMARGGKAVCRAVSLLVQHMAAKVNNDAEFRRETVEAIVSLMEVLPEDSYSNSVRWLIGYALSEESFNRLFSLEVVGRLMYSSILHSQPITNNLLFACIYSMCDDTSVSVRVQAFKILEETTEKQADCVKKVLDTIFDQNKACRGQLPLADVLDDPNLDLFNVDFLPSGDELTQFLRNSDLDQSVHVRNSALQVLESIPNISDSLMAGDCRDSNQAAAVRENIVISPTENYEKTSISKVGKFMRILRGSPHHMSKIRNSEVFKVVKIIEKDSLPAGLFDMTKKDFFNKVDRIVQHNVLRGDPFCPICLRRFWNEKERDNHVAFQHNKERKAEFCCVDCERSFMSEIALQYHKRVHHSSEPKVKCTVCKSVFNHPISLLRHSKIHNEEAEKFKCDKCEKSFLRKDKLTRHKQSVHDFVNIKVNSVDSLKNEGKFTCKMCRMSFSGLNSKDELIEHLVRKCQPVERLGCNLCDKDFSTRFNLTQHKRSVHFVMLPQNVFCCEVESRGFVTKYKSSLTRHKSMHSDL